MKPRHQLSRAAIELIKRFEGYRKKAAQLADGRWTIGYGHTLTAREGAEVSESDAEALLLYDLIAVAHAVNEWTFTPLTQNQFDALCAFASNIGVDNFRRSSVLRRVNEGQMLQAACAMELWRKADFEGERIVIDALVRRRSAEKTLFLTPTHGWVPAPSPILRPNVDNDAAGVVPRETPTAVTARMEGPLAVADRADAVQAPMSEPASEPTVELASVEAPTLAVEPVDETAPTPTQAAAAVVTSRLSSIFRDEPVEVAPVFEAPVVEAPVVEVPAVEAPVEASMPVVEATTEPTAEPEPEIEAAPSASVIQLAAPVVEAVVEPVIEPVAVPEPEPEVAAEPVIADTTPAPLAAVAGERAFVLTPPEEDEVRPEPETHLEMPAPANESEPGLFDRPLSVANDHLDQPEPPREERRILIDDTLEYEFDSAFSMTPEQPQLGLPLLIGAAILGLAVFAGGLVWSFTARNDVDSGLLNPMTVGWMACLAGIGFFVFAAYLMLNRLGHAPEDMDEDADR
jgi:lysozyme